MVLLVGGGIINVPVKTNNDPLLMCFLCGAISVLLGSPILTEVLLHFGDNLKT